MLYPSFNQSKKFKLISVALLVLLELFCMKHFSGNHSISQLFVLVLYCAVADIFIWLSYRAFFVQTTQARLTTLLLVSPNWQSWCLRHSFSL